MIVAKKTPKKSEIEMAADEAKQAIENMAEPRCPIPEYIAALKDVKDHIEVAIEAAEQDLKRSR